MSVICRAIHVDKIGTNMHAPILTVSIANTTKENTAFDGEIFGKPMTAAISQKCNKTITIHFFTPTSSYQSRKSSCFINTMNSKVTRIITDRLVKWSKNIYWENTHFFETPWIALTTWDRFNRCWFSINTYWHVVD